MSNRPILLLLKALVTGVIPLGEHLILGNLELPRIRDRQLEIVSHEYGVNGAHFFAKPAVDAKAPIDHVIIYDLLVILSLGSFQPYGVRWTHFRAQTAPHTAFLPILMAFQNLCAAKTIGKIVIDFRISEGHRLGKKIAYRQG
jgi:hypothetical protein